MVIQLRKYHLSDIKRDLDLLRATSLENYIIVRGGVHVYKPREISHKGEYHVHDHPEIFIALSGRAELRVNEVSHEFKAGDIVVIEEGEEHHVIADEHDPITLVWLDLRKRVSTWTKEK